MKKILLLSTMILLFASCTDIIRIVPSENYITENREMNDFSEIAISGVIEMLFTQGDKNSVVIETSDNMMQYIETKKIGNTLHIGIKSGISINGKTKIIAHVTATSVNKLTTSGTSSVVLENDISGNNLTVNMSGASSFSGKAYYNSAAITTSGTSVCKLSGAITQQLDLNCSGASQYNAFDLVVGKLVINLSGTSIAQTTANESISGKISGASALQYTGTPAISVTSSGTSTITKK